MNVNVNDDNRTKVVQGIRFSPTYCYGTVCGERVRYRPIWIDLDDAPKERTREVAGTGAEAKPYS